jgi:hypothetical protein
MPFGLQGAPFTYSTLMVETFTGTQGENLQVYLDNVETGAGKTLPLKSDKTPLQREHEAIDQAIDLSEFTVFPRFREANMSINPGKSPLLAKKKATLGHIISRHGISKAPDLVSKFKTIMRKPITGPKDIKTIHACLRYMSRFISSLSEKT